MKKITATYFIEELNTIAIVTEDGTIAIAILKPGVYMTEQQFLEESKSLRFISYSFMDRLMYFDNIKKLIQ